MKKGFTHNITEKLYCEILEQIKLTNSRKTPEECLFGKGYDGTFWDGGNNKFAHYKRICIYQNLTNECLRHALKTKFTSTNTKPN